MRSGGAAAWNSDVLMESDTRNTNILNRGRADDRQPRPNRRRRSSPMVEFRHQPRPHGLYRYPNRFISCICGMLGHRPGESHRLPTEASTASRHQRAVSFNKTSGQHRILGGETSGGSFVVTTVFEEAKRPDRSQNLPGVIDQEATHGFGRCPHERTSRFEQMLPG